MTTHSVYFKPVSVNTTKPLSPNFKHTLSILILSFLVMITVPFKVSAYGTRYSEEYLNNHVIGHIVTAEKYESLSDEEKEYLEMFDPSNIKLGCYYDHYITEMPTEETCRSCDCSMRVELDDGTYIWLIFLYDGTYVYTKPEQEELRPETQTGSFTVKSFHDFNFLGGKRFKSVEAEMERVAEDGMVQINDPEYKYYEELNTYFYGYYDWRPYSDNIEEYRWIDPVYYYAKEEDVEAYLEEAKQDFANDKNAEFDFIKKILIVYPYSFNTGEEASTVKEVDQTQEWGTISIQGYMDKDILKMGSSVTAPATIVFKNLDTGESYTANLQSWSDYATSINVSCGHYIITSGFFDDRYPFNIEETDENIANHTTWSKEYDDVTSEGVYVGSYENEQVEVTFGTPVLKEELNTEATEEEKTVTREAEEEVVEEETNSIVPAVILLAFIGLIFLTIWILKKRKESMDKAK